jgi:hypothetical protein
MPNIVFNVDLLYRVYLDEKDLDRLPIIKEFIHKRLEGIIPVGFFIEIQDLGTIQVEPVIEGLGTTALLQNFIDRLKK